MTIHYNITFFFFFFRYNTLLLILANIFSNFSAADLLYLRKSFILLHSYVRLWKNCSSKHTFVYKISEKKDVNVSFNPLPHTTNLQQMTSKIFCQKYENKGFILLKRVENIVAKGKIACFEQFLLLSQCF